jgi:hypothetical protein
LGGGTTQVSFHSMAKRCWHDIFSPCFNCPENVHLGISFPFDSTVPLSYKPTNCWKSSDWRTTCPCTHIVALPFYFVTQPVNNTEHHVVFQVSRLCPDKHSADKHRSTTTL